ncbi:hypothetical protein MGL_3160 [Malassezia globosa CBS 7966]|uniref:Ubiquitin-like protease family profile domain-containing protein n=1 Tax=Malassezia globosa (strain ATCC MYA-4612 / CBS 7966) TaxID=425265 RepID=A8Q7Y7_MALGO|nr:uncharacterized protein MGL_3160 [Malassezia globosa CBS 7966]EDP42402.1 hypothetical protein MGL_3160 [Malassezia globosa CBS 7966]
MEANWLAGHFQDAQALVSKERKQNDPSVNAKEEHGRVNKREEQKRDESKRGSESEGDSDSDSDSDGDGDGSDGLEAENDEQDDNDVDAEQSNADSSGGSETEDRENEDSDRDAQQSEAGSSDGSEAKDGEHDDNDDDAEQSEVESSDGLEAADDEHDGSDPNPEQSEADNSDGSEAADDELDDSDRDAEQSDADGDALETMESPIDSGDDSEAEENEVVDDVDHDAEESVADGDDPEAEENEIDDHDQHGAEELDFDGNEDHLSEDEFEIDSDDQDVGLGVDEHDDDDDVEYNEALEDDDLINKSALSASDRSMKGSGSLLHSERSSDNNRNEPDSSQSHPHDQRPSPTASSSDSSVIVIDDSDSSPSPGPVSHERTTSRTSSSPPTLSTPPTLVSHPCSSNALSRFLASRAPVAPARPSHFRPQYFHNHAAGALPKTLFRSKRIDAWPKQNRRTVSSLSMRRKAPLAMDDFEARINTRQQARIASMIRQAYQAMRRGGPRLSFDDFHSLVKKRVHVQQLMDLETLQTWPMARPVLDEQAYTQRTLDLLKRREAHAQAQLPPPVAPLEARRTAVRQAREKRRSLHGILGRPPLPASLPPDSDRRVSTAFQQRGVIASMPGAQVEAHDMAKLRPGKWLNDEVINFYGQLIQQRSNDADAENARAKHGPCAFWRVHVFSSFFWQNLTTRGYAGVRRWSRRVDLFTKDLVLMPINVGQAHWVCAAINLRLRRFEYYDSMGMPSPVVFERLRAYLQDEMRDKKHMELDLSDWTDFFADYTSPQQRNGYDCGVFAVQTLEQLSRRDPAVPYPAAPLDAASFTRPADPTDLALLREEYAGDYAWNFAQENMPYLRRRMAFEICTKQLLS